MYADNTEALSEALRSAARTLDLASEVAEQMGWPALSRDLAVALITVRRGRSEFVGDRERTDTTVRAFHGDMEGVGSA